MATDFYPEPQVSLDALLRAVAHPPFDREVAHVNDEDGPTVVVLTVDRANYVHAYPLATGVVVSRYGHNDPEPVLRALETALGVRFGPEHERTSDYA